LGQALAALLQPSDLALFSGDLGTGKTFLARAVLRALGVPTDVPIASPTFTLVQEYETARAVVLHVDLYRLRGASEAAEAARLGLAERRAEGAISIVEWGEGLEAVLGPADLRVHLTFDGAARAATIAGERFERVPMDLRF
jgi:tRNA threonylcarbamoyl adenosine modification protein YjeE